MPGIADIPLELFVDDIFNYLTVREVLNFGAVNHFFNSLANDEAFWHQRIEQDFNFSGADTARRNGWKFLYKRLSNPAVYVWGEKSAGRLGLETFPPSSIRNGVPYPVRLSIPGAKIVSLVASGMSFHALDSHGDIHVWGTLDGTQYALRSDGFCEPGKTAQRPMLLRLPIKFRSLSCGRLHTTALDVAAQVWTFISWGRPFRLDSSLVDKSRPETTPVQVESGWAFSAILTQSGDVLVYWPYRGQWRQKIKQKREELDRMDSGELKAAAQARPTEAEPNIVPCYWWVLHGADPVILPSIPSDALPALPHTGLPPDALNEETKLVKIAALDNNIIGLTNTGHVLRYGNLDGEDQYQQGHWEYLPLFSDVHQLKELSSTDNELDMLPDAMLVTHISASFHTFFAYSVGNASTVLMGKDLPTQSNFAHTPHADRLINNFRPIIIPELQNQSVISVVLGDYHYGALTATGKLLTWGQFSEGALGLGDPKLGYPSSSVRVPTEVRFDHGDGKRSRYCFAAAAQGWHTGALVIDLDPDQEDVEEHVPNASVESSGGVQQEGPSAPSDLLAHIMPIGFGRGRGAHPFRVGFAGRGSGPHV